MYTLEARYFGNAIFIVLETRLGVNALSTQFVQVNSDSLIVAIRLLDRYQFKRSAGNFRNHFPWIWCERKLRLRVSQSRLMGVLDSLFYMLEPKAEYGKRSVLITLENFETCISLNCDFSFPYGYAWRPCVACRGHSHAFVPDCSSGFNSNRRCGIDGRAFGCPTGDQRFHSESEWPFPWGLFVLA